MIDAQKLDNILPVDAPMKNQGKPLTREYFYHNVLKLLAKPSIKMCENGIQLDMEKVYKLDKRLEKILNGVATTLKNNEYVAKFQAQQYKVTKAQYIAEQTEKQRQMDYYLKEFNPALMDHRSYLMNYLDLTHNFKPKPQDVLPNGKLKWTAKAVKELIPIYQHVSHLQRIVDKDDTLKTDIDARVAMKLLASDKSSLYNIPYIEKIKSASPETLVPAFNPGSTPQKDAFFKHVGVEPIAFSKDTGNPSWGRKVIQEIKATTKDPILENALDAMIEFSQGSIVKTNFVKGFIDYSIDGRLTSNIKLFGTKTMRPTSGGKGYLNFLNMPSTGSIFAKPIKECIISRPGFVQLSSDFSALNTTLHHEHTYDENKQMILSINSTVNSSGVLFSNV